MWRFIKKALAAARSAAAIEPIVEQIDTLDVIIVGEIDTPVGILDPDDASREKLHAMHNAARAGVGVQALRRNDILDELAWTRALKLAYEGNPGYVPNPPIRQALIAHGYDCGAAGENTAGGYDTAGGVMTGWFQSAYHYGNMVSRNFTDVGYGCVYMAGGLVYWCVIFARRAKRVPPSAVAPRGEAPPMLRGPRLRMPANEGA